MLTDATFEHRLSTILRIKIRFFLTRPTAQGRSATPEILRATPEIFGNISNFLNIPTDQKVPVIYKKMQNLNFQRIPFVCPSKYSPPATKYWCQPLIHSSMQF